MSRVDFYLIYFFHIFIFYIIIKILFFLNNKSKYTHVFGAYGSFKRLMWCGHQVCIKILLRQIVPLQLRVLLLLLIRQQSLRPKLKIYHQFRHATLRHTQLPTCSHKQQPHVMLVLDIVRWVNSQQCIYLSIFDFYFSYFITKHLSQHLRAFRQMEKQQIVLNRHVRLHAQHRHRQTKFHVHWSPIPIKYSAVM